MTEQPSKPPIDTVANELKQLGISKAMLQANPFKLFLLGFLLGRENPLTEERIKSIVNQIYRQPSIRRRDSAHPAPDGRRVPRVDDPPQR